MVNLIPQVGHQIDHNTIQLLQSLFREIGFQLF